MKLYVIRHGETEWNYLKVMQGSVDIPLNEQGKKQAKKLQKLLNNRHFDLIISSPLLRAKETAEIVNKKFKKRIIIDDRLAERNYGEFEGVKKADFDYFGFWDYNLDNRYERAENIKSFYNRVVSFIEELKNKYSEKTILLSTHGGICKIIELYFHPDSKNSNDSKLGAYLPDNAELLEYEL
ncbi:MAG TPA: histidine phosphatase family protein [Bacilli bacterium]|nr:histidine phosphatase family protein [Bacilli bacterium]